MFTLPSTFVKETFSIDIIVNPSISKSFVQMDFSAAILTYYTLPAKKKKKKKKGLRLRIIQHMAENV